MTNKAISKASIYGGGMLKFWKGANIRLVNVVSGINRVSFQKLLEKIIPDDLPDTYRVSSLIYKKLLSKLPELIASSEGIVISLHRKMREFPYWTLWSKTT